MDIFNIKPHVVSRDLRGYIVLFYGEKKSGKTTNASMFPKPLLAAFEKGYNALEGVMAANLEKWTDFKKLLKQLKKPEAKEIYETIVIDTADIAYELCEEFIFMSEGVNDYSEIPFGQGYAKVAKEFDKALRSIPLMGYGLVIISHSTEKTFTDKDNVEYTKIVTTMPKKCANLTTRMADIIGYAAPVMNSENGESETILYLRGTKYFEAGSRFKYTPNSIVFTYDNLVGAIHSAVEKQEKASGRESVDEAQNLYQEGKSKELDFKELMGKFSSMTEELLQADDGNRIRIQTVIEATIGKGKRVDSMTPDQAPLLDLIVEDLKNLF